MSSLQTLKDSMSSLLCRRTASVHRDIHALYAASDMAASLSGSRRSSPEGPCAIHASSHSAAQASLRPRSENKDVALERVVASRKRALKSSLEIPFRTHAALRGLTSGKGGTATGEDPAAPPSRSRAASRSSQRTPRGSALAPGSHCTRAPATSAGGCGQPTASRAPARPSREVSPGASSRFRHWAKSESSAESRPQALRRAQNSGRTLAGTGGSGPASAA
mmetsp:Transcript_24604/g.58425  ORF Transcript_24604/g.58425 Transcript_24604/m.58425 type:complete len:221 (-) Transcript_24604:868-1530(-)